MEMTAVLTHAVEGGFIALNPETGTTTQGETVEEAVDNLRTVGRSSSENEQTPWSTILRTFFRICCQA